MKREKEKRDRKRKRECESEMQRKRANEVSRSFLGVVASTFTSST